MKRKSAYRVLAALVALATFVVGCSSDKKTDTAAAVSSSPARGSGGAADFVALGGWQDPACSASQPKVTVGISEPIDIAGTSLKDYVDGTQAAVEAFNARGGISGRCLDLKVCDGQGDGPRELSCARQETEDASMVAGLASTFLVSEGAAYQLFESAGLPQVGAQVALPGGWNSPVSYEFNMGASGTLLAGMPALNNVGVKKFVIFVPVTGQVGALAAFAGPLVKALGMNLLDIIQIPPTAVEFTQFVIKAQNDGADGAILGLPGNVASQVLDAADSLSSPLKFSSSWGTLTQKGVTDLPTGIQSNMAFTDAVPPVVANSPRWPIFNVMLDDFKAAGKTNLTKGSVTAQATNGWLAVYTLVKVMRDAKPTDINRATVKAAFDAAKDIPMFDLMPPWTPSKQSTNAIFKGMSNPMYWTGHWDSSTAEFVVDDKQVDILALLG
jgi:ABC-type branched-subunit amino acid transport system substrate-binding protein